MIDLLIESINEWNKLYYVVDLNQQWVCFNDMITIDLFDELVDFLLVSLLQWHQSIVDLFAEQVNFFLHS